MSDRRSSLSIFFVLACFGLLSFLSMLDRPAMANIRAVDVVRLIGTGMCFGAALVVLGTYLHNRPRP